MFITANMSNLKKKLLLETTSFLPLLTNLTKKIIFDILKKLQMFCI